MSDERDFEARQATHRDHASWELQHEAWLTEAAGWVRRIDDHRETSHARLTERQRQLARRLALVAELFPQAD